MTEKNGIVIFECDKDNKGEEILNSSQRNNKLVWPSEAEKPKAQYRTSWKNMCNATSYIMFGEYAGYAFPTGEYEQPEDNLCKHILTSPTIRKLYETKQPAMYNAFIRSLDGKCTAKELSTMYFPNELHDYLCLGFNEWIGSDVASFTQNINFKKALWHYMVDDNLPMVISTTFGGFGHIVCVTGVQYKKEDWIKGCEYQKTNGTPEVTPVAIIVDDPWGNASKTHFESYPAGGGGSGNDIVVPWDIVVKKVKPCNSDKVKWAHTIKHAVATI